MSKISQIFSLDNEQIPPQTDLERQVYKQKRLLRQKQAEKRDFQAFSRQLALLHYAESDQSQSFTQFYRQFKKEYKELIDQQIKEHYIELNKAKSAAATDPHLFDLQEQRREQIKLQRRLENYNGDKILKIGKKNIPASIYAHKKSMHLQQCSTFVIRREFQEGSKKLMFRNSCRDRACPVCGSFLAKKTAKDIIEALKIRLIALKAEELKRGRLVHMVLTVKNVPLNQILDVKKAWRIVQKNKNRVFKKKKNEHEVWQHVPWGFSKFEVTRNDDTGLYHPHLHILAWVDGWMATTPKKINRVVCEDMGLMRKVDYRLNDAQKSRIEQHKKKGEGWWTALQKSWRTACKEMGLVAHVNGSKAIKGAKTQHVGGVLWFTKEDIANKLSNINDLLGKATAEISKYVAKSNDLMSIESDDELLAFMAKLHGQQLLTGFGGMALDPNEPEEIESEIDDQIPSEEVVYRFDFRTKTYVEVARFKWDSQAFKEFRLDMSLYKLRPEILNYYETIYRRSISRKEAG